jgi:hypothetical protein
MAVQEKAVTMTTITIRTLMLLLAIVGSPAPTVAQSSVSDVLRFLVVNQSVETGSIERDRAAAEATSATISRAVLTNLATLPVTASSAAFVYRLNPELGMVERASESFGPVFVERAITAGAGGGSFGIAFQHMRFTSLDGHDLRNGSLVTTANQFVDDAVPFDLDRLTLAIDASVATVYGSVGVTDWAELAVVAPLVRLHLSGSRLNTYRGTAFQQAAASSTAVGLADVLARAKVAVFKRDGAAVAAAAEFRLPTGREEDLLGTGSLSTRLIGIGSVERGAVSTHVNAGVLLGGLAREFHAAGALAVTPTSRLSITAEALLRRLESPGLIRQVSAPHPTLVDVRTLRLSPGDGARTIVTLAPGLKWNLSGQWVLVTTVSVPLTNDGLTTPWTPFVGLDYAIGR